METEIIEALAARMLAKGPTALVTVIEASGPTPATSGAMMVVSEEGRVAGTVGGGSLEHQVLEETSGCLRAGQNKEMICRLADKDAAGAQCTAIVRLFVRIFQPRPRLVIAGAGHIGKELYKLAIHLGFQVVLFDSRAGYGDNETFPGAEAIHAEDLPAALTGYPLEKNCFVAIATNSHDTDRDILEAVLRADVSYVGMIGSKTKISRIFQQLLDKGVKEERLASVYAPMGLNIASVEPQEIALSIMSEILLVKNNGSGEHLKTVKNVGIPSCLADSEQTEITGSTG